MHKVFKYISLCFVFLIASKQLLADTRTIEVKNINDSGSGSLREAVESLAQSAIQTDVIITFDPSAFPVGAVTTINISQWIDIYRANFNRTIVIYALGRVKLRGIGNKSVDCFHVDSEAAVYIYGLYFENFNTAIARNGGGFLQIGDELDADKANILTNNGTAISSITTSADIHILGNFIGTNRALVAGLGNDNGITVISANATIKRNFICASKTDAIYMQARGTGTNFIENNTIGLSLLGLGNGGYAITGFGNFFINNNKLYGNNFGINISRGQVELRNNQFSCNKNNIFTNNSSSPALKPKPIITNARYFLSGNVVISGTSDMVGDVIEIYESEPDCINLSCQGFPRATAISDSNKQWSATLKVNPGNKLYAIASIQGIQAMETSFALGSSSLFTDCITPECPITDINVNFQQISDVRCFGGNDGAALVSISFPATGGLYEYTVTQTDIQPNITRTPKIIDVRDTIKDLKSGKYRVTVRNKLTNCPYSSSNEITIIQPTIPLLPKSCGQTKPTSSPVATDGEAEVKAFGGYPPYKLTYRKDTGPIITFPTTSDSLFVLKNLGVGAYFFNITDSRNGPCSANCNFSITPPICSVLKITITQQTDVKCFGGNTGSVKIKYADISSNFPLILKLSNGDSTIINNFSSDSTFTFSNLKKGNYIITLYNKYSCTPATNFFTIIEPPKLDITCDAVTPAQKIGEASGTVSLTIRSGGSAPYNITITGAKDTSFVLPSLGVAKIVDKLKAGNYIARVTDGDGCSDTDTCQFTIKDPNCNLLLSKTIRPILCQGESNGSIKLTATGGIGTLAYKWEDSSTRITDTANNLKANIYRFTVTDAQKCSVSDSARVTEPLKLIATALPNNISKIGDLGGANLTVSGGIKPYIVRITPNNVLAERLSDNAFIFRNLTANTYTYEVIDSNNCKTAIQNFTITQPPCNFTIAASIDTIKCNGESSTIRLTTTGGASPFIFVWTPPSVSTTNTLANVKAGTYAATVTDNVNCVKTISNVQITEPSKLTVVSDSKDALIVGGNGNIGVKVQGGVPPYIVRMTSGNAPVISISRDSFVFNNLPQGTYTYSVSDANNCSTPPQVDTINDPQCIISTSLSISKPISCFGASDGAIALTVANAKNPRFEWSGGLGTIQNPTNVGAGTYTVSIKDSTGCTDTKQITLTQPPQITASMVGDTAICSGQSARLRFTVTGANVFSLVFSNGVTNTNISSTETFVSPTSNTTFNIVSVQAGVCMGNVSGSAKVQVTTLPVPTGLVANKDTLCVGSTLSLSLTPSVLQGIQYLWQTPTGIITTTTPSLTITNATNINSGAYTVRLSQNGCFSATTTPLLINVLLVTREKADAGVDKTECGNTSTTLAAGAIIGRNITGKWLSLDGATVLQPNSNTPSVSGLKTGTNRFIWLISSACDGEMDRDTVIVSVALKPVLTEAEYSLEGAASSILINLKELIKDTTKFNVNLIPPTIGAQLLANKQFIAFDRSNNTDAQTIEIPYQVCTAICPNLCEKSRVFIKMSAIEINNDSLRVPHIFERGVGVPLLRIENIDRFENNECLIVDRWGIPVFGPKPYKNDEPENAWNATKSEKPLPNGAYYWFIWDKSKSLKRPFKGVIYLIDGR